MIPVPEVAEVIAGAHVVLVDPFLPRHLVDDGVLRELRELFAEVVPFAYVLGDVTRFPGGTSYLPPQPGTPFRRLAQQVRREFSELPMVPTRLESAVPHVVVPEGVSVATPVAAWARRAQLLTGDPPDEQVLGTFPFGTSAA